MVVVSNRVVQHQAMTDQAADQQTAAPAEWTGRGKVQAARRKATAGAADALETTVSQLAASVATDIQVVNTGGLTITTLYCSRVRGP